MSPHQTWDDPFEAALPTAADGWVGSPAPQRRPAPARGPWPRLRRWLWRKVLRRGWRWFCRGLQDLGMILLIGLGLLFLFAALGRHGTQTRLALDLHRAGRRN